MRSLGLTIFLTALSHFLTADAYQLRNTGIKSSSVLIKKKAVYANKDSELFGNADTPRSEKDASFSVIRSGMKASIGLMAALIPSVSSKVFFLVVLKL